MSTTRSRKTRWPVRLVSSRSQMASACTSRGASSMVHSRRVRRRPPGDPRAQEPAGAGCPSGFGAACPATSARSLSADPARPAQGVERQLPAVPVSRLRSSTTIPHGAPVPPLVTADPVGARRSPWCLRARKGRRWHLRWSGARDRRYWRGRSRSPPCRGGTSSLSRPLAGTPRSDGILEPVDDLVGGVPVDLADVVVAACEGGRTAVACRLAGQLRQRGCEDAEHRNSA
jgi:hypothetical protein